MAFLWFIMGNKGKYNFHRIITFLYLFKKKTIQVQVWKINLFALKLNAVISVSILYQ